MLFKKIERHFKIRETSGNRQGDFSDAKSAISQNLFFPKMVIAKV